ncbi:hypothetical protein myaer87_00290 [Microcystis aeruginosa NIES-87]|nr:hypothetical protein myaer87_00290 [Microcystis aeruginosa NIES-87]
MEEIGWKVGRQDVLGTDPVVDTDARVIEVKISLDHRSSAKVNRLTNLKVNVITHPNYSGSRICARTAIHNSLEGDAFLISPRSTSLIAMESFSERRLLQVLSFNEVELVSPIYVGYAR